MNRRSRLLFIGPVNKKGIPEGGQEFKNQLLIRYLQADHSVVVLDTRNWKRNPVLWLRLLLLPLVRRDFTILSLASLSGLKFLKLFGWLRQDSSRVLYLVLGGWFPKFLRQTPSALRHYTGLHSIMAQSKRIVGELEALGLGNVHYFPNFKEIPKFADACSQPQKNRFIYLSRIDEEKGAQRVIDAVKKIASKRPEWDVSVDFYGKVAPDYEGKFSQEIEAHSYLTYKGFWDLRKPETYVALKGENYYGFLFCSTYYGEGFPGVVIDAMIMGVPMIVTDWNDNAEFIQNEKHGFVVPPNNEEALIAAIERLIANKKERHRMAENIAAEARNFDVARAVSQLQARMAVSTSGG